MSDSQEIKTRQSSVNNIQKCPTESVGYFCILELIFLICFCISLGLLLYIDRKIYDMEKVVILARVSSDRQDYERQVNELTGFCHSMKWEVVRVFANKISGAKKNEDRPEIIEMLTFVKENDIKRVCCLEVSRLGRNTLEALKIIQILTDNNVSLYIKNYNIETLTPDGKQNPVASLITTILLEISQMERQTIRERMKSGHRQYVSKCRENNIRMGRPSDYKKGVEEYKEQYQREITLLKKGLSLRNVSQLTSTSINTLRKLKSMFL